MLGGAIRITDLDGDEMLCSINMDRIRRYNVLKEKKRKERKRKEKKTKGWPRQKLRQKDPIGLKPERVVQEKYKGKTMVMAKIPSRTSWAKITWQGKKNKEKKRKIKIKIINK